MGLNHNYSLSIHVYIHVYYSLHYISSHKLEMIIPIVTQYNREKFIRNEDA